MTCETWHPVLNKPPSWAQLLGPLPQAAPGRVGGGLLVGVGGQGDVTIPAMAQSL
jgi:hypothetical protein